MNCWVLPRGIVIFEGETVMETKAGCPTVRFVEEEIEPEAAVMLAVPTPALVAKPFVPELLLTIATRAADELHVATEVIS